jgi:hypothetical protein
MPLEKLHFIEDGQILYRGFGREYPAVRWNPPTRAWSVYTGKVPKPWDWGQMLSPLEAERVYPGSASAPLPAGIYAQCFLTTEELIKYRPELFDGYDGGSLRYSPGETEAMHSKARAAFARSRRR